MLFIALLLYYLMLQIKLRRVLLFFLISSKDNFAISYSERNKSFLFLKSKPFPLTTASDIVTLLRLALLWRDDGQLVPPKQTFKYSLKIFLLLSPTSLIFPKIIPLDKNHCITCLSLPFKLC